MNTPAFNHRYGLALAGQEETAAELRAQLVEVGNRARVAEESNGRTQTRLYRLLLAGEQLLTGRLTLVEFGKAWEEGRRP